MQELLSLQITALPDVHWLATQVLPVVHLLLSGHDSELAAYWQPASPSQLSVVHGFWSLQFIGGPAAQVPSLQVSPIEQTLPSLHSKPSAGGNTQPDAGSQASVVQASPSLHPMMVSSSIWPSQLSSLPLQSSLEAMAAAHSGKGPTAVQLRLAVQVPAILHPIYQTLSTGLSDCGQEGGLLSPTTSPSRQRVQAAFVRAVAEATDAPADPLDSAALARLSYLAHLSVLLWWLLDRSPQQRATAALLELTERALPGLALLLRLPPARRWLRHLDEIATDALGLWREPAGQQHSQG